MMVQNNYTPLVVLVVIILIGAMVMGVLLTNTELLNPTRAVYEAQANATLSALSAEGTRVAIQGIETPRALQAQVAQKRTLAAEDAVQGPAQATATQAAAVSAFFVAQVNGTRTAIAVEAQNKMSQAQATQTRLATDQQMEEEKANAAATRVALETQQIQDAESDRRTRENWIAIAIVLAILAVTAGVVYTLIAATHANRRIAQSKAYVEEKTAEAKVLIEQRRTLEVEAAVLSKHRKPGKIIAFTPPHQPGVSPTSGSTR